MKDAIHLHLSKRESQIVDVLFRRGEATVKTIRRELGSQTSYDAVRVTLRVLEEKGHVTHREEDGRFVYRPTMPLDQAKHNVLRHVVSTFFQGSAPKAVAALFDVADTDLDDDALEALEAQIAEARRNRSQRT
ncbi:MAG: BlaI/MecI/CopY family transcriptional regulator [Thermoanaerobaculia bacterium]|nr:BlaI/MecI/CopY family transcriptional regulator [Thermoanaerobaculia bacterium]